MGWGGGARPVRADERRFDGPPDGYGEVPADWDDGWPAGQARLEVPLVLVGGSIAAREATKAAKQDARLNRAEVERQEKERKAARRAAGQPVKVRVGERVDAPWGSPHLFPWGRAELIRSGFYVGNSPVRLSWCLDGRPLAYLVDNSRAPVEDELGLISVEAGSEVAGGLGPDALTVVLRARGQRFRGPGRSRYLLATAGDRQWTLHQVGADGRKASSRAGRLLGSAAGPLELRRGGDHRVGEPLVTITRIQPGAGDPDPPARKRVEVVWADGVTLPELALAQLLWSGTDTDRLGPFWQREVLGLVASAFDAATDPSD